MRDDAPAAVPETKVTFRMPKDLHRRLKITAARKGKSVQEILNGLTEAYVNREEQGG